MNSQLVYNCVVLIVMQRAQAVYATRILQFTHKHGRTFPVNGEYYMDRRTRRHSDNVTVIFRASALSDAGILRL